MNAHRFQHQAIIADLTRGDGHDATGMLGLFVWVVIELVTWVTSK